MQKLPAEFIDELRTRYDIVELISQYVQLKKTGRNYFGLCPFHAEKTPSFSVSQDKQIFHCFGCGEGGNVYSFLMKIEGLTFPEAVRQLAERAGIPLPQTTGSPAVRQAELTKNRLRQLMQLANRYFQYQLQQPGGRAAKQYLQQRGVAEAAIDSFNLGWAPAAWRELKNFLLRRGYQEKELLTSGLLSVSNSTSYDRFRGRIIYPSGTPQGEVIAFGGRAWVMSSPSI